MVTFTKIDLVQADDSPHDEYIKGSYRCKNTVISAPAVLKKNSGLGALGVSSGVQMPYG